MTLPVGSSGCTSSASPRRAGRSSRSTPRRRGCREVPDGPGARRRALAAELARGVAARVADRHPAPRVAARHGPRAPAHRPHPAAARRRAPPAAAALRATSWRSTDERTARGQDGAHLRRRPRPGRGARPPARRGGRRGRSSATSWSDGGRGARRRAARGRPRRRTSSASTSPSPARLGRRRPAAEERFGRLDVLVNNAGVVRVAPIVEETDDGWAAHHGRQRHRRLLRHARRDPRAAPRRRRLDHQHRLDLRAGRRARLRRLHRQQGRGDRDDQGRRARARRTTASASTRSARDPSGRR